MWATIIQLVCILRITEETVPLFTKSTQLSDQNKWHFTCTAQKLNVNSLIKLCNICENSSKKCFNRPDCFYKNLIYKHIRCYSLLFLAAGNPQARAGPSTCGAQFIVCLCSLSATNNSTTHVLQAWQRTNSKSSMILIINTDFKHSPL